MDRKIQKLLTLNRMHHAEADMNRIYVPRWRRNLGICFKTATIGVASY